MPTKNEIAAIVTTTIGFPAIGSGAERTISHRIDLVKVEAATRGGTIKKYRTYPGSPVYSYDNRYNRTKVLQITGDMQANAARLFAKASYGDLSFDDQASAQQAIIAA